MNLRIKVHYNMHSSETSSPFSLLPLLCFLIVFLGTGIYFTLNGDASGFYQFSPAYATIPAIIIAAIISRFSISNFFKPFITGMSHKSLLSMCLIFLLSGIFSAVAKSSGGIEATVNLGLAFIPSWFMLPGLFMITAFIATAMGTSVGTIAAIAPVSIGITQALDIEPAIVAGVVVSGAMFGDNLSIISDTTIAATRTQHCKPKDKFRENVIIALPAALITILLFYFLSLHNSSTMVPPTIDTLKVMPYLLIFILAMAGVNVFAVLVCGIVSAGTIGLLTLDDYQIPTLINDIQTGSWNMKDIILLSMLIGGLGVVMENQGGLLYIKQKLDALFARMIKGSDKKSETLKGELAISSLVAVSNLATANNTIAIILSGRTARMISTSYRICPKRTASLLDIFSCVIQGLIPWGAQLLLLGASFSISPLTISLYSFYPVILALVTLAFIFFKP